MVFVGFFRGGRGRKEKESKIYLRLFAFVSVAKRTNQRALRILNTKDPLSKKYRELRRKMRM